MTEWISKLVNERMEMLARAEKAEAQRDELLEWSSTAARILEEAFSDEPTTMNPSLARHLASGLRAAINGASANN